MKNASKAILKLLEDKVNSRCQKDKKGKMLSRNLSA